jgi:hypothetical protein
MTKGQKWGFGLGIGVLVIGMSIVSYLLWKEKKAKNELKEVIAPTPPAPAQIAAAAAATEVAATAAAARSAQKFSA